MFSTVLESEYVQFFLQLSSLQVQPHTYFATVHKYDRAQFINVTAEAGFLTLLIRTTTPSTRGIPTGRKHRAKLSVSVVPSN
jgi:hypothetical protein